MVESQIKPKSLENRNQSPSQSPKKRCSDDIKLRIQALQVSGCCLDDDEGDETTSLGQTRRERQRGQSAVPNGRSTFGKSDKECKDESNNNDHPLVRTSIQLPLTPNIIVTADDSMIDQDPSSPSSKRSSVSFADMTDVRFIPPVYDDDHDSLYYKEDELANFRHEAFLEDCGLSHMMT
ncbi:unnamed protein product [Cylindrotheca closterium]|uniref:Uncharacterized protein n=1 Tax=Cylindrotheca closterium TaxID=2856 RepID=A0AAD2GAX7_9STRA|nr:unnamed protein product [Cylindrotheca closterium]